MVKRLLSAVSDALESSSKKSRSSGYMRRRGRTNPRSINASYMNLPLINKTWSLDQSIPRMISSSKKPFITISQTCQLGTFGSSTVTPGLLGQSFSFGMIGQNVDLGDIFDQYRITTIEWWTVPHQEASSASGTNHGIIATVIDYDDSSLLTTLAQFGDYTNCIQSSGVQGHYRSFHPHVADTVFNGAVASGYGNVISPWIDVASPLVPHYGIKALWTVTDAAYAADTFCRITVQLRSIR